MQGKKKVKVLFIILIVFWSLFCIDWVNAQIKPNSKLSAPQWIHVYRHSDTSLKITWQRVSSVDGYAVYRYDAKTKKYQKIRTIKAQKKNQIMDNGLKTNKTYCYLVKAYVKKGGKNKYGNASYEVSAKTYRRNSKAINAGGISSDKKVTLGITMSKKMDTYVRPSKYGKNKKKRALTQKIRWKSSNEEIATVTSKGKIIAGIKEGTCTVYAIAHNGNRRKIKVTVVNYAYPTSFDGYGGWDSVVNVLLSQYKNEICNIASYFTIHRSSKSVTFSLNEQGEVTCDLDNLPFPVIKMDLDRLLKKFPVNLKIVVDDYCVRYLMETYDEDDIMVCRRVVEYYYNDFSQGIVRIAKHWRYYRFVPEPYHLKTIKSNTE